MSFYLVLYMPALVALAALICLLFTGSRKALLAALVLSTITLFIWGVFNWFFRDGMGPDSVSSSGYEALRRFFVGGFWLPLLAWGILVAAALYAYWFKRDRGRDTA